MGNRIIFKENSNENNPNQTFFKNTSIFPSLVKFQSGKNFYGNVELSTIYTSGVARFPFLKNPFISFSIKKGLFDLNESGVVNINLGSSKNENTGCFLRFEFIGTDITINFKINETLNSNDYTHSNLAPTVELNVSLEKIENCLHLIVLDEGTQVLNKIKQCNHWGSEYSYFASAIYTDPGGGGDT